MKKTPPDVIVTTTITHHDRLTDTKTIEESIHVLTDCPDCGSRTHCEGRGRAYPEFPEPVFKCLYCRTHFRVDLEAAGLRLNGYAYERIEKDAS